ncbi:MAG: 3-hydroxy-3-methylglutaryl CoA synthase, partial [Chloroflexota bacterium]|nr:3-hydroxy-3-methylglutaryl CoA synthase [Chloroflexota bacterium]
MPRENARHKERENSVTGIVSYGAYVPIYRMGRDLIARQWGGSPQAGERSVANFDEDSITMAVEAVVDCLGPLDRHQVDGLYFASTTPPYHEKQSASIVAAACDLRRDIFTAHFTGSLRSATSALRAAQNAIQAGAARRVVVVASDCRQAAPASDLEPLLGDGAAAFLLGDSELVAEMEGSYSLNSESL